MAECMDRVRVVRADGENRLLMSRRLRAPSGPVDARGAPRPPRVDRRRTAGCRPRWRPPAARWCSTSGRSSSSTPPASPCWPTCIGEAGRLGGRLAIVAPEGPARRIFALTRTDGYFCLVATREEALAAIAPPA